MTTKYADRAFLSMNGVKLVDLQSATLRQTKNAKVVPSMTPDQFNRGFVQGNTDIDITCAIAVQNQVQAPKLGGFDFENNDIQITWLAGADVFIATGIFNKDDEQSAGGVGEEVKRTFNFGAIKLTDQTGVSALFDLSL